MPGERHSKYVVYSYLTIYVYIKNRVNRFPLIRARKPRTSGNYVNLHKEGKKLRRVANEVKEYNSVLTRKLMSTGAENIFLNGLCDMKAPGKFQVTEHIRLECASGV